MEQEIPKLTIDALVSTSGILLSLLMGLIPPFRKWMEENLGDWKFLFMAGFLLVVAVGYNLAYCALAWACIQAQLGPTLLLWVAAVLQNQGVYKAVVKPLELRAARDKDTAELAALKWG